MKSTTTRQTHGIHLAMLGLFVATASAAITEVGRYSLDSATPPIADSATADGTQSLTSVQGSGFTVVNTGLEAPGSTAAVQAATAAHYGYFNGTAFAGFTDNFAMEVWVRPNANMGTGNHDIFCMANNGGTVKISLNGGKWCGIINGTTFSTGATASLLAWTPVAIVRSGGVSTLYVNGIAQSGTSSTTPVVASPMLFFGPGGTNGYQGQLDEARILTFAAGDNVVASLSTLPAPRTLTWDADGTTGGATGGTGTWNSSGTLWDNAGTMTTWNPNAPDNAVFGGSAGTVTLGSDMHARTVTFNTAGYVINTGSYLPNWSTLAGSVGFTKNGSGTLTLTGASTATGTVTVNGGNLVLGNNAALGTTSVTLDGGGITRAVAAATVANAISIGAGGGTISGRTGGFDNYVFLSSPVSGSGPLTLKGLVSLANAANGYNGTLTLVNAGSLTMGVAGSTELYLSSANNLPSSLAIYLSDSGSGLRLEASETIDKLDGPAGRVRGTNVTLTVGANHGSSSFAGAMVHSGGLTKTGSGTFTLGGTNTYTGATTVNDGALVVIGSLGNTAVGIEGTGSLQGTGTLAGAVTVKTGGKLSPGGTTIGTLRVNNTLTLQTGSTTLCQINKTSADPVPLTQDQLTVNAVIYGGTLEVTATGDPLDVGDSFKLFNTSSYGGSFTNYTLPSLSAGLSWDASKLAVDGTISVVNTLNTPVLNPPAGGYTGPQTVSITSNTGSTIYYTLDGSDPHTSGSRISTLSPATGIILTTPSTPTIRAYAEMAGFADSAETSASYIIITAGTWVTNGGGNWSDTSNWQSNAVANGSGITADFSTLDLAANATVTLEGSRNIGKLVFGDISPDSSWVLERSGAAVLTMDATVPMIEVVNQAVTVSAVLGGTNGLTKTGAGELTLVGSNTYTGGTIVSEGVLKIGTSANASYGPLGASNNASTSVSVLLGGTLDLNGAAASGEGVRHGLTLQGAGTAGQGALINTGASGSYGMISTPNIALAADATIGGTGDIYMISPAYAANSLSLNGHTLTKSGSNTLWLGSTTGTSGTLRVAQGTVSQNSFAGTNNLSSVAVSLANAAGATLALNSKSLTIGSLTGGGTTGGNVNLGGNTLTVGADNTSPDAFAGAISGTGSIIKTGTGTLALSGSNTYTGNTTVNDGALTLAASGSLKFVITATSGMNNRISGAGTVTLDGAFEIDTTLADASTLTTGSWQIENVTSLTGAYGSSFRVSGFTDAGGDQWIKSIGVKLYTFDETTGTLTLSPFGFDGWASANGVTGGPSGDSDNDGIKNLVEYALNLNFAGSDGSPGTYSGNSVSFTKRAEAITNADVTYVIETSTDLVAWTPVVTHAPGNTDPTISYNLPSGGSKIFCRLNVMIP